MTEIPPEEKQSDGLLNTIMLYYSLMDGESRKDFFCAKIEAPQGARMTDETPPSHQPKPPEADPPLYLALVGHPSLSESSPRKVHLLLPETLADRIDNRVAGSRNTAFIVLLQAGLDFFCDYAEVQVSAERNITTSGYDIPTRLSDGIANFLGKTPQTSSSEEPCLKVWGRMGTFSRKPHALLLPKRLADAIDTKTEGARNSVFVVLLSVGMEIFRQRALKERTVPIVRVGEFFKAQGYERKDMSVGG